MALSDRNLWCEAVLDASPRLPAEAHRLAWALDRLILGFAKREERLGDELVRATSGLHGRSLDRARQTLIDAGLVHYESGGRGRGKRSLYALLAQNPAEERARIQEVGSTARAARDDNDDEELAAALAPVVRLAALSSEKLDRVRRAWAERPHDVRAHVARALRDGQSPVAFFWTILDDPPEPIALQSSGYPPLEADAA